MYAYIYIYIGNKYIYLGFELMQLGKLVAQSMCSCSFCQKGKTDNMGEGRMNLNLGG